MVPFKNNLHGTKGMISTFLHQALCVWRNTTHKFWLLMIPFEEMHQLCDFLGSLHLSEVSILPLEGGIFNCARSMLQG